MQEMLHTFVFHTIVGIKCEEEQRRCSMKHPGIPRFQHYLIEYSLFVVPSLEIR